MEEENNKTVQNEPKVDQNALRRQITITVARSKSPNNLETQSSNPIVDRSENMSLTDDGSQESEQSVGLSLDLDNYKTQTKEEKLKAYYQAIQNIENPEEYRKMIRIKETELLAEDLGVDQFLEGSKFGFFLKMCLNAKLPNGYSKELSKTGALYYFNRNNGSYSNSHPCLSSFKELLQKEYKKVVRSFSGMSAVAKSEDYTKKTCEFFKGGLLKDMTLYKISKYFKLGNDKNYVTVQEDLKKELKRVYQNLYGYKISSLIRKLKKLKPMSHISLIRTKSAIKTLNIRIHEYYLVWVARLYCCLPFPDGWEEMDSGDGNEMYKNWHTGLRLPVRPCYYYALELLRKCRKNKAGAKNIARIWLINGSNHVFEDGFNRIFVVENAKLFEDENHRIYKMLSYGLFKMFKLHKNQRIVRKNREKATENGFVHKVEKYLKNPDMQDHHLLEVARELGIDYNDKTQTHLLFFVFNYIVKKSRESNWAFRNPQVGECYWINHKLKRISATYPFLEELTAELKVHKEKIEFKAQSGKRLKNLSTFQQLTGSKSLQETISKVADCRDKLAENYVKVRTDYNYNLYVYMKKQIEIEMSEYNKRQKMTLEAETKQEKLKKPEINDLIAQPFNVSEFAQTLITKLTKNDVRDILFYNFFNLDVTGRNTLGDGVLKLGKKDVMNRCHQKLEEIKRKNRVESLTTKLLRELGQDLDMTNNANVDKMVDDARRLISLATKLKLSGTLESIVNDEFDRNDINIQMKSDFMTMKLNFLNRYGKKGDKIKQIKLQKKWDRLQMMNSSRKKKKKKKRYKKKNKRYNVKNRRPLYEYKGPRFRKVSKRSKMRRAKKMENLGESEGSRSINSAMRDALEKTLNTEMEGEDVELNSLEGEMRINIFKPINNKTVKKKFRSVVNKTRSMLNVLRRSRTYQNMPSTRQMNQPRVRRGSRRGSRINNLLITRNKSSRASESPTRKHIPSPTKSRKNRVNHRMSFQSFKSLMAFSNGKGKSPRSSAHSKQTNKYSSSKSREKKPISFLSVFRSHLKLQQKNKNILPGVTIPEGYLETRKSSSNQKSSSTNKLTRSESKMIRLGNFKEGFSRRSSRKSFIDSEEGDSIEGTPISRINPDNIKKLKINSSKLRRKSLFSRDPSYGYKNLLQRNSTFGKLISERSLDDFERFKLQLKKGKPTLNHFPDVSEKPENSELSNYLDSSVDEHLSALSSLSSDESNEQDLQDQLALLGIKSETQKIDMIQEFKKAIDTNLGNDIVKSLSSNIEKNFKTLMRKRNSTINLKIGQQKVLLKTLIKSSIKRVYKDNKHSMPKNERRKIFKMVKLETKALLVGEPKQETRTLLMQLLSKLSIKDNKPKKKNEAPDEKPLILQSLAPKVFEFETGEMIVLDKDKMLQILGEFNNFFEYIIREDISKKEKMGSLDYETLLNLLKYYLTKVMKKFKGWSNKETYSINQIIERTKKAFFAVKMNKQFLASKKKYIEIDVFERLTTIETTSFKKLFTKIKAFLFTFRAQYTSKPTGSLFDLEESMMYKLVMPKAVNINSQSHIDQESSDSFSLLSSPKKSRNYFSMENSKQNLPKIIDSDEPGIGKISLAEGAKMTIDELRQAKKAQDELRVMHSRYQSIKKIIEKLVARALFEMIDFSKIEQIEPKIYQDKESLKNSDKIFSQYKSIEMAKSLRTTITKKDSKGSVIKIKTKGKHGSRLRRESILKKNSFKSRASLRQHHKQNQNGFLAKKSKFCSTYRQRLKYSNSQSRNGGTSLVKMTLQNVKFNPNLDEYNLNPSRPGSKNKIKPRTNRKMARATSGKAKLIHKLGFLSGRRKYKKVKVKNVKPEDSSKPTDTQVSVPLIRFPVNFKDRTLNFVDSSSRDSAWDHLRSTSKRFLKTRASPIKIKSRRKKAITQGVSLVIDYSQNLDSSPLETDKRRAKGQQNTQRKSAYHLVGEVKGRVKDGKVQRDSLKSNSNNKGSSGGISINVRKESRAIVKITRLDSSKGKGSSSGNKTKKSQGRHTLRVTDNSGSDNSGGTSNALSIVENVFAVNEIEKDKKKKDRNDKRRQSLTHFSKKQHLNPVSINVMGTNQFHSYEERETDIFMKSSRKDGSGYSSRHQSRSIMSKDVEQKYLGLKQIQNRIAQKNRTYHQRFNNLSRKKKKNYRMSVIETQEPSVEPEAEQKNRENMIIFGTKVKKSSMNLNSKKGKSEDKSQSLEPRIEKTDAYKIFNSFRKYNRDLINKCRIAVLETLSADCIEKIAHMDKRGIDEIKKKIESRLTSMIKNMIFIRSDLMKEVEEDRYTYLPNETNTRNKQFLSKRFKFKLGDVMFRIGRFT